MSSVNSTHIIMKSRSFHVLQNKNTHLIKRYTNWPSLLYFYLKRRH